LVARRVRRRSSGSASSGLINICPPGMIVTDVNVETQALLAGIAPAAG